MEARMATHSTPLTTHARVRMQQRGIPAALLEDLLDYGRAMHDHRGATVLYFDKRARAALARSRALPHAGRRLDAYAVLGGDGEVRTVGHLTKRLRRPS
jgi:hypothetical protein